MPIQGYHLDLSTGACGAVLRSCCSNLFTLWYGTVLLRLAPLLLRRARLMGGSELFMGRAVAHVLGSPFLTECCLG